MNIDWYPNDIWAAVDNPEIIYVYFDEYYATLIEYLDQRKIQLQKAIDEAIAEASPDELEDDFGGTPYWLIAMYDPLENFDEFENLFLGSFFVMLISYVETELIKRCHNVEKYNPGNCTYSEFKKIKSPKNTQSASREIRIAIDYIKETKGIKFDLRKNTAWTKILMFYKIRNCIVHHRGELNGIHSQYKDGGKIYSYSQQKNSKLKVKDMRCVVDREFCKDAFDTIRSFLTSLANAPTQPDKL